MSTFSLILKEIRHRKINFVLSLLAVLTAVSLFVAFVTMGKAYRFETRRVMRNMGQNLRIIPKETSIDEFWSEGFSQQTMPEEYVHRFASLRGFSYTHLTATLQKKIMWRDMNVILTGILPEVLPADRSFQKPMVFSVALGTAYIGFEIADKFEIKAGDVIDIGGTKLNVVKCLSVSGSSDDIRIYGHLHDIQKVLGMSDRINEIKALECLCIIEGSEEPVDPLTLAQQQLAKIMPEGKVILLQGIAKIRQQQRAAMEGYLAFIFLFVIIACGAWIGTLTMINVRDRKYEIGIMRALGYGGSRIATLFLGKAVIIGVVAAIIGFIIGTVLALQFGPEIFKVTAKAIKADTSLFWWSLLVAPIFAALCSFIPTAIATGNDPAITLREE